MKITPEVHNALSRSISKWIDIVAGTGVDKGTKDCALCQLFIIPNGSCVGCPIEKKTGNHGCHFYEYTTWCNIAKKTKNGNLKTDTWDSGYAAVGMLNFLLKLRKKCKVK